MEQKLKSPGLAPRAIREGRALHNLCVPPSTPFDRRAQFIARRFRLKPWIAADVAWLCFGEGRDD